MNSPRPFSAVLLAAGHSTRMGREKALLEIDGAPLWSRQRAKLARAGATEIFLSARTDQSWAAAADGFAAVVRDAEPGGSPLAGIVAALERAAQSHLAVLAVDLPRLKPSWFATLLHECAPGVGAAGRREKFFEPLAAVYPRELLPLARAALAAGDCSLQRLLAAAVKEGLMREREIADGELPQFANWNGPSK